MFETCALGAGKPKSLAKPAHEACRCSRRRGKSIQRALQARVPEAPGEGLRPSPFEVDQTSKILGANPAPPYAWRAISVHGCERERTHPTDGVHSTMTSELARVYSSSFDYVADSPARRRMAEFVDVREQTAAA